MRQIVLDTETTGLDVKQGHRVIEIGCVEIVDRHITGKSYHTFINPQRLVDAGAYAVHGLSDDFLSQKPLYSEIATAFTEFLDNADEVIIHNADFDVGFLKNEFEILALPCPLGESIAVFDSLALARRKHPKRRNNLDALCQRYQIDASNRTLHGALLDAELLALVYLAMTSGQVHLSLTDAVKTNSGSPETEMDIPEKAAPMMVEHFSNHLGLVLEATPEELEAHDSVLSNMQSEGIDCVWLI